MSEMAFGTVLSCTNLIRTAEGRHETLGQDCLRILTKFS